MSAHMTAYEENQQRLAVLEKRYLRLLQTIRNKAATKKEPKP